MKFSAMIEMLFFEAPFNARIKKVKDSGFDAIEFASWKGKDLEHLKELCLENQIEVSNFTGIVENQIVDPKDSDKCIKEISDSLETARYLDCKNLVIHVNTIYEDSTIRPVPGDVSDREKEDSIFRVTREIVPMAEESGITLCFEPLNTLVDHAGYYLNNSSLALKVIKEIKSNNLKLLYDIYHMYIMGEDIISTLKDNFDNIGHIHVADAPGRHEPGTGKIDYKNIYRKLCKLGYKGHIGFEYTPSSTTEQSLVSTKNIFQF